MPKRKQANIQDMLRKKQATVQKKKRNDENEVDDDRIEISPYLLNSAHITRDEHYLVSPMARVYFREHSNVNEILDRYIEREQLNNVAKENYLSSLIRKVMSLDRSRSSYPFNMFKFESSYHECIGKFLLSNYGIKSLEDLKEANIFLSSHEINHCQVSMSTLNKFREDEQEHLKYNIKKHGYQTLKAYIPAASEYALRNYYQEHNIVEKYHIDTVTLEEMCKISSIEYCTKMDMEKNNVPESQYETCLATMFRFIKTNKRLLDKIEGFNVYPQFLLVFNNLTEEQETIITGCKDKFYAYTNAKTILLWYKKYMPVDENLDIVGKRKERRKRFYLKYIRLVDKKEYPFHILLWTKKESEDEFVNEDQPGPSNTNLWKKRIVSERNDATQREHSNDAQETIINHNVINDNPVAPEENHQVKRHPRKYLSAIKSTPKYLNIINFLINQENIINEIKKYLEEIDKDFIDATWELNHNVIVWNCIYLNLIDRDGDFIKLIINNSGNKKNQLCEMLESINIDVDLIEGEPIATSTQRFENGELDDIDVVESPKENQTKRPFQSSSNSTDDIVKINDKNVEPPSAVSKIKQEIFSQNACDSDVQIVSLQATDIISIPDDSDDDNNCFETPENVRMDVYQQNLNVDSQEHRVSNVLAEYELRCHKEAVENVTRRKDARNIRNTNKNMVYTSDESSTTNGKNRNADYDNNHQEFNSFSIFFSTQLMFDYAYHSKTAAFFTHSKALKSSSLIHFNQNINYRPSFLLDIQRFIFLKNHKFELTVNLPLFSLYSLNIQNSFVKNTLNLNEEEFYVIINNLEKLENYEFVKNCEHNRQRKEDEFEHTIKKHLDLYFSSISNFKKFQFKSFEDNQNEVESLNSNIRINTKNVTKSIKSNILERIKFYKNRQVIT